MYTLSCWYVVIFIIFSEIAPVSFDLLHKTRLFFTFIHLFCNTGSSSSSGASQCTSCLAGYYSVAGGCVACGNGEYSSAGAASCLKCPAGSKSGGDHWSLIVADWFFSFCCNSLPEITWLVFYPFFFSKNRNIEIV